MATIIVCSIHTEELRKAESVRLHIGDQEFAVDACPECAQAVKELNVQVAELFDRLAQFTEVATPVKKLPANSGNGKSNKGNRKAQDDHNKAIRDWAKKNGWEVNDRGRLSDELREAFDKAHAPAESQASAESK